MMFLLFMQVMLLGVLLKQLTAAIILLIFAMFSQCVMSSPKLHPVEEVCVSYEMTGQLQNGTTTRCHRDYGYEQYEIQNITVGISGFTQTTHQHTITIGDTIYAIDLEKNTGTKTKNPMYQGLVDGMGEKDPEEMSAAFIESMGFRSAGTSQEVAGHTCNDYSSAQMGSVCLTDDGLMLKQEVFGNTTTATNISMGDAGDAANYELYKKVSISEGPDLSKGFNMESLKDLMNQ